MLPTDYVYGGWAASGEIDIMEAVNLSQGDQMKVHGTLHMAASGRVRFRAAQAIRPKVSIRLVSSTPMRWNGPNAKCAGM